MGDVELIQIKPMKVNFVAVVVVYLLASATSFSRLIEACSVCVYSCVHVIRHHHITLRVDLLAHQTCFLVFHEWAD